ncbi:MAG TPA: hypothetical protein VHO03_05930 [Ignavibacteriales bacterium]|nr:hypothetical protein [Ignavibacteriales bacterium]
MSTKFICDGVEVLLPHSVTFPDFDYEETEQKSIISGKRIFFSKSDYSNFLVTEFLNKYGDRLARLNYLKTFEKKIVKFFPNEEDITDSWNESIDFYLESIEPFFLDSVKKYGACNLIFRAVDERSLKTFSGYGFNYGLNYGEGL